MRVEFVRNKVKCVYLCETEEEALEYFERLKKDNSIDRAKIIGTKLMWVRVVKDER